MYDLDSLNNAQNDKDLMFITNDTLINERSYLGYILSLERI
ncbi:hypothetical protein [Helicobacter saguini]|nr:hypothetical protein [Helicobacter saguini]